MSPQRALGAGEDRVVVGEDGAGAVLLAEQLAVDAGGSGDQAVGRGPLEQLAHLAAAPLGGDREPAVLDEAPGVDQILDVLAGGAAAALVAALDGLGPGLVAGSAGVARAPRPGHRVAPRPAPAKPRSHRAALVALGAWRPLSSASRSRSRATSPARSAAATPSIASGSSPPRFDRCRGPAVLDAPLTKLRGAGPEARRGGGGDRDRQPRRPAAAPAARLPGPRHADRSGEAEAGGGGHRRGRGARAPG